MKKILTIIMIGTLAFLGCKKANTPNPSQSNLPYQITVNSTDPLKITMYDNDSLLVFKGNIIPPFNYSFVPKHGDLIRISIIYNNNISITESYNGKTDNAATAIEVAPKSGNGGNVTYSYSIPE